MSDLFGRLARRALGSAGALRPITPPIFGAPTGAPAGVAEPEAVTLSGPAGVAPAAAQPARGRGPDAALEPVSEARSSRRRASVPPGPIVRATERDAPPVARREKAPPRPVRAVGEPLLIEPVSRPRSKTLRPADDSAAGPAANGSSAAGSSVHGVARRQADAGVSETSLEPTPTVPRAARNPVAAVRPRQESSPATARRASSEAPLAAPPIIRVTIGRVEVRAAAPPPTPAARPARQPKLSLEAYVAGRRGGSG